LSYFVLVEFVIIARDVVLDAELANEAQSGVEVLGMTLETRNQLDAKTNEER
jgi:hypothetical protein